MSFLGFQIVHFLSSTFSFADGHKKSRHGHQFQMVARALYPWLKTSISVHRTSDVANLPSSLAILYFAACLDERI
jgi:hypothetical protein